MNNTGVVKPVRHGDQIEIEISSLAFGGDSVGRYQDFAIFVPGGLPGERVKARITQVKDHYATAEILSVLRRSPDRVEPPCDIFEECGGCQWQHFNYPRQLQTKRQFVVDALKRIGRLENVTVQPCLPSPSPFAYRNKAMPVLSMREGHFVSGIYEPRSHHLVPYHTCPIQGDAINDFIQKVLKKIDRSGLTPYQEKKHAGFLRHLAVRQGVKTGELLLAFVTRTEVPEERVQKASLMPEELEGILPRIARELVEETPGLVGVLQNINASRTNIVFGQATRTLAGRDHYFEIIDDLKLKVSLKSFLQVNTLQADMLHTIVREALGDPIHKKKWGTILDLYSGIGTLAMAVSEKSDYVVGVEEIGPAVEDAKINAELNHRSNIDFLEGDVAPILLGLKEKGLTQIDAAILDPPRKGVLPEVLARVTAFHPERLVYVSCDPSTLARDLALLVKHGYVVDWAQPLDMFPQTYHVEAVVRLTRENPLPQEVAAPVNQPELEPFRLSKPVEPVSLNISANFNAFKEKTSNLFHAVGQQLGAAFGLILSILAVLFVGVRILGRGTGSVFRSGGKVSAEAVEKITGSTQKTSKGPGPFTQKRTSIGDRTFLFVHEKFKIFTMKIRSAFQRKSPNPPPVQNRSIPAETFIARIETTVVERGEEVTSVQELSGVVEDAVSPSAPLSEGELIQSFLKPTFTESTPLTSTSPMPFVEVPNSQPQSEWRFPAPQIPIAEIPRWFRGRNSFRWALTAALFIGGGLFWAKATLLPQSKRMGLLVPMVSQMIPDVIAVMPTRNYLRFEMVPFEVRLNQDEISSFPEMQAVVEVFHNGIPVNMVDGQSKLNLKRDMDSKKFAGNWPIPYNPVPGTYIAEVTVTSPRWGSPKVFESAFTLSPLKPNGLYPGYAALTMEGGKQLIRGAVPALDGSDSLTASNAIEWAQFMGANAYCYLMGQTSIWDHLNAKDFPFSRGDMEVGRKYAKAAHVAGLKFGGYMTTFKVVGDAWNQAPYEFSLGYDPDTDSVVQNRFISLEDSKRHQDIVNFLKELDKDPDIDMVGMDYVRTGTAGYEMVDEFVKDLNVPEPDNFLSLSKQERIHWLAKTVEQKEDPQVVELFQWWRAHKVAMTLKSILDEAKMSKPVFTFTLGWQMGHQHGQDPAMFIDAGVNYNHIMLYEGDRGTMASMKKQWPGYLSRSNGMYAMGEMVDFNWVQKSIDPPGPEELYDREVDTFHNWFGVNSGLGMFWHDLYRIIYGVRGPYSSMEWAISGGKAFSTLQQVEGLSPIEVSLTAPKRIPAGVPVPISVEIRNNSPENLKGLVLHQIDTLKNYYVDLATVGPFDVPSGNRVLVKSLFVNIPKEDQPDRDNRYMAAVMVEKPGQSLRVFDFSYMKKISSSSSVKPTDRKLSNEDDGTAESKGILDDDHH